MSNLTQGNVNEEDSPPSLRADAKRNRDKLLKIAHRLLTSVGISISMDEIAKQAGVGVGTVYRHFPTKEKLFEAVMVSHKARLKEEAEQLLLHPHPGEAFFQYFALIIREGVANKGITNALAGSLHIGVGQSKTAEEYWLGVQQLLERAQNDGYVRSDVSIEDIKVMIIGTLLAVGDNNKNLDRVVSVLSDGLATSAQR